MDTKQPYYGQNPQYNSGYPPQPQPSYNPNYPPQHAPPQTGWFERNQKNKPQSNSVGAAALVFMSGGMQMANSYYDSDDHFRVSWFIGAIIGTVFGAIICNYINKKILYLFSSVLVIIGGILFVSLPHELSGLISARYIDGIASGLLFAPLLVLAGEESVKSMRGMLASSVEAMSFALGIYLYLIFLSSWSSYTNSAFSLTEMLGVLSIVYGLLALTIAFFLYVESPVFYLVRNEENQAIDSLRRLQRPFVVTYETYQQLEEHKAYVAHNKEMSLGVSIVSGLPALLKLCMYRVLIALSYSYLTNVAFSIASIVSYTGEVWTYIIMGTLRWMGVLVSVFMIDSVGRKKPMLFGALICGGMAIGIGVLSDDYFINWINKDRILTIIYLFFVFQFFVGVFIGPSSAYLSEAFPLAVKPFFIGIAFIVEMLVQIICVLASNYSDIPGFFYATASMFFVFFFVGLLTLPETKRDTLRDAQIKFRKLFPIRSS
ncbi:hexose transporter HXT13-like isoform X2 [Teleopsis dalmanni]|uniref:hexose transporter HXT13-like isoform X2 n=1 Tax=Teleopsis dalmanni TaxID=139649 RepID=UPI0018CCAE12|nr:hexose transporter HXT13-like isoform X2 [Teleopsis dalmanni]